MKKTFQVEKLKEEVNELLKNYDSRICSKEYLEGMRSLLESVLHSTGNYRGYQYLDKSEVPKNELPGCHFEYVSISDRFETKDGVYRDKAFVNVDSNRVRYY